MLPSRCFRHDSIITAQHAYKHVGCFTFAQLGLQTRLPCLQVLAGQRPSLDLSCPKALQDLISTCWAQQPEQRPDFVSILEQLNAIAKQ